MAKRKKKESFSIAAAIALIFTLAGAVMAGVGPFLDWMFFKVKNIPFVGDKTYHLAMGDMNQDAEGFKAMQAFAYVLMGLAILTVILVVVCRFTRIKLDLIGLLAALLTIVAAVLLIIFTVKCFGEYNFSEYLGDSAKPRWDVGVLLSVIGGFVAGLGGMVALRAK